MVKKLSSPRRGRPVNEATRDAIIAVATRMFLAEGLQRTPMDSIARAMHISKLTLYKRFPNKDALFTAVITTRCSQYIPDAAFSGLAAHTPANALYAIGTGLLNLITSPDAMNMERMLMAEANDKQKLTKLFYDAGPKRIKGMVAEYLASLHAKRLLHIPDPMLATHLFTALFKGSDICLRLTMNIPPKPSKTEIEHYCRAAVASFLAAHQPKH
jgi:TetR/AcrR family transcriptional regulator, mexJK operon transcriptional repressor